MTTLVNFVASYLGYNMMKWNENLVTAMAWIVAVVFAYVVNKYEMNGLEVITIVLDVDFFDYIVDANDQVVRGNKYNKVRNGYRLTFVSNKEAITSCPNCNAPLEQNAVICNYCQTKMQGARGTMKLSQKQRIR